MSIINHVVASDCGQSYRVNAVRGSFDFTADRIERSWSVEVPSLDEAWSIGAIVGPSGSGKTQIARKAFGADVVITSMTWDDKPIIDAFPASMSPNEICALLSSVGLGSVPSWFLPYSALSGGQRFRADMARVLADTSSRLAVVDEFTSVVDRTVAKTCSCVVAKHVRAHSRRLVAVACHYDIVEWLEPDWVLDMSSGKLARGCLQRRPEIVVDVCECGREAWGIFKAHHYLAADLARRARCFVAMIESQPAAFCATINYPHVKYGMVSRIHRVVTLPDYQGLGLALHLMRVVASAVKGPLYISTTHGPFAKSLAHSGDWICCRARGFCAPPSKTASVKKPHRNNVLTSSFRFVGKATATTAPCTGLGQEAGAAREEPSTGGQR